MAYDIFGNNVGGYDGNSMSNRGRMAYERGLMPLSKWTKNEILERVREDYDDPEPYIELLSRLPTDVLKDKALRYEEWHHTSGAYNRTSFYGLNYDFIDNLTEAEVQGLLKGHKTSLLKKKEKKEAVKEERWYAEWTESVKSGRRFKQIEHSGEGIVKDGWFYLPDGSKKAVNGRHFNLIKQLNTKNSQKGWWKK